MPAATQREIYPRIWRTTDYGDFPPPRPGVEFAFATRGPEIVSPIISDYPQELARGGTFAQAPVISPREIARPSPEATQATFPAGIPRPDINPLGRVQGAQLAERSALLQGFGRPDLRAKAERQVREEQAIVDAERERAQLLAQRTRAGGGQESPAQLLGISEEAWGALSPKDQARAMTQWQGIQARREATGVRKELGMAGIKSREDMLALSQDYDAAKTRAQQAHARDLILLAGGIKSKLGTEAHEQEFENALGLYDARGDLESKVALYKAELDLRKQSQLATQKATQKGQAEMFQPVTPMEPKPLSVPGLGAAGGIKFKPEDISAGFKLAGAVSKEDAEKRYAKGLRGEPGGLTEEQYQTVLKAHILKEEWQKHYRKQVSEAFTGEPEKTT